jgi:hypothetical protein
MKHKIYKLYQATSDGVTHSVTEFYEIIYLVIFQDESDVFLLRVNAFPEFNQVKLSLEVCSTQRCYRSVFIDGEPDIHFEDMLLVLESLRWQEVAWPKIVLELLGLA